MRDIIFRGKRIDDDEWVYGGIIISKWGVRIQDADCGGTYGDKVAVGGISRKVHVETVGQYTGLLDHNGKKIFEGDIMRFCDKKLICKYGEFAGSFGLFHTDEREVTWTMGIYSQCEIIGNIHENLEILGGARC